MINKDWFDRITIVAGGSSISDGIKGGLWDCLKNEPVIATNYAFRFLDDATFHSFVDYSFMKANKEEILKMPLAITRLCDLIKNELKRTRILKTNLVMLPSSYNRYYGPTSFVDGVYSPKLVGMFALTVAICLGFKNIYLLGYDFGAIDETKKTHFYEGQIDHRGVGFVEYTDPQTGQKHTKHKTPLYERDPDSYFECYKSVDNSTRIFNVSPKSRINVFPKISYDEYFDVLKSKPMNVDQNELRKMILKTILISIKRIEMERTMANIRMLSKISTNIDKIAFNAYAHENGMKTADLLKGILNPYDETR